ncbi:MAG TPA: glycosyltransferase family A protein [Verrucomicrobiae bacterium]|nr:glycosyltransferase family A protein [Verrucomicrobiae bacterium]
MKMIALILWHLPVILWLCLFMTLANLLVFRGLRPGRPLANPPLVSILVPARNEALNIEACVESLMNQNYPNWELIVLDDNSTDGTAELVERGSAKFDGPQKVTLLKGAPLPDGWTGKNWACHQLSLNARGDYLFFTDADTIHAADALSAAARAAVSWRADLLSAWPRFVTKTLGEKLIIPIVVLVGFVFTPHWLVALLQRFPSLARIAGAKFTGALGTANGQFMFFSRRGYQAVGGHEAVRAEIVEDVALGRRMAAQMGQGLRLCVGEAFRFSKVRMYRSFGETWAGFAKNLRALFGSKALLFWAFILGLWFCFLGPVVKCLWAPANLRNQMLFHASMVLAIRWLVTLRCRTSWLGALLHPLGVGLVMAIAFRSWWLSRGPGVEWKGRTYRPGFGK